MSKKLIVISAVNIVEAGTLTILKECLSYLSLLVQRDNYRVIAIVYKKDIINIPYIEYIETTWPKKRWINRLWFEYVSLNKVSKQLGPVYLWFSLHDTTPTVKAERRAVYCHNSYFHYKWKLHDLLFAPKIAMFSIFTKFIYRTNIYKNNYLVVQQDWFRGEIHKIFKISLNNIIVARPESPILAVELNERNIDSDKYIFVFPASPNSHKNFEVICKAAEELENRLSKVNFCVYLTVSGKENKYASWLLKKWGHLKSLKFVGFVNKEKLFSLYEESNCLIFPSKVESWGLPISEYAQYKKPMLLADLPYAHETSEGSRLTAFFDPDNKFDLVDKMYKLINNDSSFLREVPIEVPNEPIADNWEVLFDKLLLD